VSDHPPTSAGGKTSLSKGEHINNQWYQTDKHAETIGWIATEAADQFFSDAN